MLIYEDVFRVMNQRGVEFILIGGLNFFLRYQPVATRDIDLFVESTKENLSRCESALADLNSSWGLDDDDWGPVKDKPAGWLGNQSVYCLLCDAGEIDVFTTVAGIPSFLDARHRATLCKSPADNEYWSLSAEDMIACQMALPEQHRRQDRISYLENMDTPDE